MSQIIVLKGGFISNQENGDANIEKAKDKAWREEKNLALELKLYSPKKSQEYSFARLIEVEVI